MVIFVGSDLSNIARVACYPRIGPRRFVDQVLLRWGRRDAAVSFRKAVVLPA